MSVTNLQLPCSCRASTGSQSTAFPGARRCGSCRETILGTTKSRPFGSTRTTVRRGSRAPLLNTSAKSRRGVPAGPARTLAGQVAAAVGVGTPASPKCAGEFPRKKSAVSASSKRSTWRRSRVGQARCVGAKLQPSRCCTLSSCMQNM